MVAAPVITWGVAAASTAGVIFGPRKIPEAAWALGGALLLVCAGLLPLSAAADGIEKGGDVYLFLAGMMLLAEIARAEGLFDWLAARAVLHAHCSPSRLFALVYAVGVVITVFLSNDATAVVLTPAVAAVTRAAKVKRPLPYLLICALIANAASFVLPISNPANLVPPLLEWLPRFALPSLISICATYAGLLWTQRKALRHSVATTIPIPKLSTTGKIAASGIALAALGLTLASALGMRLGLPTCLAGILTTTAVSLIARRTPWRFVRGISWGVIPLVAGLFILVEALDRSGALGMISAILRKSTDSATGLVAAVAGVIVAVASNLINNLPAGLIAGMAVQSAHAARSVSNAILIGVDLGPNLSVTGSLATILWLAALRREGLDVNSWDFLKVGLVVMPPALLLSLAWLCMSGIGG
jgi:arsenical pump membrane protein